MTKKQYSKLTPIHFMLRAQQLIKPSASNDSGYAMVIVSILTIFMFSLLLASMTLTNLNKSATNAYVDGTNTFFVAESGLNKRAEQLRRKFIEYTTPSGLSPGQTTTSDIVTPANISHCLPLTTTTVTGNDFECRNYSFGSTKNTTIGKISYGGSEVATRQDRIDYTAFTFVADKTNYLAGVTPPMPQTTTIPAGEAYAGLRSQEYLYTVYSVAAKPDPTNPASPIRSDDAKTVLEMNFKSRIVPLFQFAAFYEDDLEMNSQMPMTISGPIHTNSNLRAISYGYKNGGDPSHSTASSVVSADLTAGTRLLGKVTAVGSIYERVRSDDWRPTTICSSGGDRTTQTRNCGVVSVYKGSGDNTDPANFYYFPDFASTTRTDPLTSTELLVFGGRMLTGSNGVRRLSPPKPGFLREKNYVTNAFGIYYQKADLRLKFYPDRAIPFDFTPIKSGSGCSIATMNIPSDRQNSASLSCTPLTKGQLRSLQQPVTITTTLPVLAKDRDILTALRVAIAASDTLVKLYDLGQAIPATGWGATFRTLINNLSSLSATEKTDLLLLKPNAIVAARGSSFLTAPIQLVTGTANAANDDTDGGFYNSLKDINGVANGKWMTMLQVNIKSLTYWNRDGIYVEPADSSLQTAYVPPTTIDLSSGVSTDNLAFIKSPADSTAVVGSFANLGLAAADRTEGGSILHATISNDTNGNGTTSDATDISVSSTSIPGKDANGDPIAEIDKYRSYPSGGIKKSPYAFVFSGGEELPGALTIATDQAAYIQGDYNNPGVEPGKILPGLDYRPSNSTDIVTYKPYNNTVPITGQNLEGFFRQPAAIIADTITVLSNECVNNNGRVGRVDTVQCGVSGTAIGSGAQVQNGIAINAAFLSNLMRSGSTAGTSNGGLNKYMRLLENWGGSSSGTYYNYTGSMVSLGEPLESDKVPDSSGVPRRNFNYESRFDSFEKLPPLTPTAIYLQQNVFKRSYD